MESQRLTSIWWATALLLVAASCTNSVTNNEPDASDSPDPGFRLASTYDVSVVGKDYQQEHGENNRPGETDPNGFIIAPGGNDDLAWVEYEVGNFPSERPVAMQVNVNGVIAPGGNDDLPLIYWVALANTSANAWQFMGPYTDDTELELNTGENRNRYVTASNDFRVMIITDCSGVEPSEDNPKGLTAVEVSTSVTTASSDYLATMPIYPFNLDVSLPHGTSELDPETQYVTVSWEHLFDTSDPKNEARRYFIKRQREGEDTPIQLGHVRAPTTTFTDPVDNIGNVEELIPGETYTYYVYNNNSGGNTPVVEVGTVTIPE